MHYTFFDVETPNRRNDRICSIGLVQTDETGSVVERKSLLIDPETGFDDVNMRIHGIAPIDIHGKPTFPEAWMDTIYPMVRGTRMVAHNARFDLCAITKALVAYDLEVGEPLYADTMAMARSVLVGLDNYKLPTVCAHLGIPRFAHHRAEADADACMSVFWSIADSEGLDDRWFSRYVYRPECRHERAESGSARQLSEKTRDTADLVRLLGGVISDGVLDQDEATGVLLYILSHDSLAGDPTFDELASALQVALSDGDLSPAEARSLESKLESIVDPASTNEHSAISFDGKRFVLTGNFEHGSKDSIKEYIEKHGGTVVGGPSKKVSYVVIGGCGSDAYAMGAYGTKVKKALDLQAKGADIRVIQECDLFQE